MVIRTLKRKPLSRTACLARGRRPALALAWLSVALLAASCVNTAPRVPAQVLRPRSGDAFRAIVQSSRRPILAVFTSTACPGCRLLEAGLDDLADDCAGLATVVQADLGCVDGVIVEYDLVKLPTSIVLRDGREVARRTGAAPGFLMKAFVEEALRQPRQ